MTRPPWVDKVIGDIDAVTIRILGQASVLIVDDLSTVRILAGPTAVISDLEQSLHDLGHVYIHLESVRRALIMAWPQNDGDEPKEIAP